MMSSEGQLIGPGSPMSSPGHQQQRSQPTLAGSTVPNKVLFLCCNYCPYMTRFTGNLAKHVRTHTGERPFKCHFCLKRFASKSNFNTHLSTHTDPGDGTLHCPIVGCLFAVDRPSALHRHIKAEHGGTDASEADEGTFGDLGAEDNLGEFIKNVVPGADAGNGKGFGGYAGPKHRRSSDQLMSGYGSRLSPISSFVGSQAEFDRRQADMETDGHLSRANGDHKEQDGRRHHGDDVWNGMDGRGNDSLDVTSSDCTYVSDAFDVKPSLDELQAFMLQRTTQRLGTSMGRQRMQRSRPFGGLKPLHLFKQGHRGLRRGSSLFDSGAYTTGGPASMRDHIEQFGTGDAKLDTTAGKKFMNGYDSMLKRENVTNESDRRLSGEVEYFSQPSANAKLERLEYSPRAKDSVPSASSQQRDNDFGRRNDYPIQRDGSHDDRSHSPAHRQERHTDTRTVATPGRTNSDDSDECTQALIETLVKESRLFRCTPCNILFPEYSVYVLHLGCHGNDTTFQCHYCRSTFSDRFAFLTHFMRCPRDSCASESR